MTSLSKIWVQNARLYSGGAPKATPTPDPAGPPKKEKRTTRLWRRLFGKGGRS